MTEKRAKVPRCTSCRWWERSNNFTSAQRDWGLCHFWVGKSGRRIPLGFIDYSYGHGPRGADTYEWHKKAPERKKDARFGGKMPEMKCDGELP